MKSVPEATPPNWPCRPASVSWCGPGSAASARVPKTRCWLWRAYPIRRFSWWPKPPAPHRSASWKRSPTPKQRRWWPSMETVSTSPTLCWHMASTAAQRLAAAAPCTGGWPNSSSNPNYGRVTSRCPIPPANRVPSKPLTPRLKLRAAEERPPPLPSCLNWQSVWAATPQTAESVVQHRISTLETPPRHAACSSGLSKSLRRPRCEHRH